MQHMGRAFSSEARRDAAGAGDAIKDEQSALSGSAAGNGGGAAVGDNISDIGNGIHIDFESQSGAGGGALGNGQDDGQETQGAGGMIGWGGGQAGTLAAERETG